MSDIRKLLGPVRKLHEKIRATVIEACERATLGEMAKVVSEQEGDTIFALDRVSEEVLVDYFEREVAPLARQHRGAQMFSVGPLEDHPATPPAVEGGLPMGGH